MSIIFGRYYICYLTEVVSLYESYELHFVEVSCLVITFATGWQEHCSHCRLIVCEQLHNQHLHWGCEIIGAFYTSQLQFKLGPKVGMHSIHECVLY